MHLGSNCASSVTRNRRCASSKIPWPSSVDCSSNIPKVLNIVSNSLNKTQWTDGSEVSSLVSRRLLNEELRGGDLTRSSHVCL